MEAYKRWIRRNKDTVHRVNTITGYLMWLLPSKFYDSEIGPEAVSAIYGVISTFNEHIIETIPNEKNKGPAGTSASLSLCISALKELEILFEVTAEEYYGSTRKLDFIAAIEALKFIIRLALFDKSGYRMILNGGDTPNMGQEKLNLEPKAIMALSRFRENAMKRLGLAVEKSSISSVEKPSISSIEKPSISSVEKPSISSVENLSISSVEKPSISSVLSTRGFRGALFLLGELLFITRPLLFVLLVRKYGSRSWIPWILSLNMDFIGVGFFSPVSFSGRGSKDRQLLSDMEKSELTRRKKLWALYIMRDPFFTKYTRTRLDRAQKVLQPVPVIGILAEKAIEIVCGFQTMHGYISGS